MPDMLPPLSPVMKDALRLIHRNAQPLRLHLAEEPLDRMDVLTLAYAIERLMDTYGSRVVLEQAKVEAGKRGIE